MYDSKSEVVSFKPMRETRQIFLTSFSHGNNLKKALEIYGQFAYRNVYLLHSELINASLDVCATPSRE